MLIDDYAWQSPLRAWHPAEKIHITIAGLTLSLVNPYPALNWVIFALFSAVIISKGRVRPKDLGCMLLIPALFLAIGAITVIVSYGPGSIYVVSWQMNHILFGITQNGLATAELLISRVMAMVSVMYFLSLTTPVAELTSACRAWKMPEIIGDLIYLIYRGIYLLATLAEQIMRAQSLRLGYYSRKSSFNSMVLLVTALFTQGLRRSHEMTVAMLSRGQAGQLPDLPLTQPLYYHRIIAGWLTAAVGIYLSLN